MKTQYEIESQLAIYQDMYHKHIKTCELKTCETEKGLLNWIAALKWSLS